MEEMRGARYDEWHLEGVGAGTSPDSIERGCVWIAKGTTPDPALLAWIAGLERSEMVQVRENGVPDPS